MSKKNVASEEDGSTLKELIKEHRKICERLDNMKEEFSSHFPEPPGVKEAREAAEKAFEERELESTLPTARSRREIEEDIRKVLKKRPNQSDNDYERSVQQTISSTVASLRQRRLAGVKRLQMANERDKEAAKLEEQAKALRAEAETIREHAKRDAR